MGRQDTLVKFALLSLLLLFMGGPMFENIDPWDAFPDGGDTTILILCAAAVCFGAILLLATRLQGLFEQRALRIVLGLLLSRSLALLSPPSPPLRFPALTPLRI